MATTAVVVGTAGAVSHKQQQKYANQAEQQQAAQQAQQNDAAQQQQIADMQAQQAQFATQRASAGKTANRGCRIATAASATPAALTIGQKMAQLTQLGRAQRDRAS